MKNKLISIILIIGLSPWCCNDFFKMEADKCMGVVMYTFRHDSYYDWNQVKANGFEIMKQCKSKKMIIPACCGGPIELSKKDK